MKTQRSETGDRAVKMRARLSELKNLLPLASLTGGFTLITLGVGEIFGMGAGMISGGLAMVILGAPIIRS